MVLSKRVLNSATSATVRIADKAQSIRENGDKVFDFSAGRAFEHTPKYVLDAAIEAMRNGETHQTMAKGTTAYRAACAIKLKRENAIEANPETEIVATMGCKQGLTVSLLTILNPGDEVIVEDPCFVSYQQTINYLGGVPVAVPLLPENKFRWKREQLEKAITSKTKAIIFCTPHNPTGVVHTLEDLEEIAYVAKKHNLVVITDEPYERTVWGGKKHLNLATLQGMDKHTITLMSLTKSFSMGGWRLGFAYANPEKIRQMSKLQQHLITCVNSFAQAGGIAAYSQPPKDEVLDYWLEWEKKVVYFTEEIDKIEGLSCYTPEGGFYAWVDISATGISSDEFCDRLLEEQQVAIIPGASFGQMGENYVRINCVKSWEEIEGGLKGLTNFVESLP
ncbi:pyridoxal phosphate-dependent aminotransferase [Flagellimonas sp. CMM7]|uniref:pyridoxal phosphate-dependent aminotransferase n=1 Tax=Flagellimonas sp. CMM7 TaxID=2654676 RepID=UPI0013D5F949|nr:aminotransferase class I/II-fold pyridoxal phosphate-dependent enzyme [Flagellimonas sp. CMM7]UII80352.1 aminotransferase class I/II-fold pyridoxal phosphate-dependent enzyme [Flagellimonas sp. CMM7]